MYKIKFWRFAGWTPGPAPFFVQNSGNIFVLDFPAGLCYKRNNFILLKAVRRTNGVRHSAFQRRPPRQWPRAASGPDADHTFTTAECGGEPPPGTARYSRREWRLPYRGAQVGWNRGVLQCFIPENSKG